MNEEYSKEMLEKLASNPHYSMGRRELMQLKKLREDDWAGKKFNDEIVKHDSTFKKNDVGLKKEGSDESVN